MTRESVESDILALQSLVAECGLSGAEQGIITSDGDRLVPVVRY